MRERSLVCTTEEIRGLLDGSLKTILIPFKCANPNWEIEGYVSSSTHKAHKPGSVMFLDGSETHYRMPSLGAPGDRLWVKESYTYLGSDRVYKADGELYFHDKPNRKIWYSPGRMLRCESRITTEIVKFKAENINGVWMEKYYVEAVE